MGTKVLSLIIEHDGQVINLAQEIPEDSLPKLDESLYFEGGWTAPDEHGCVGHRTIDLFVANLAQGDSYSARAAAEAATHFAIFVPDFEYTEDQRRILTMNYNQDGFHFAYATSILRGMRFRPFYPDIGEWGNPQEVNPLEGHATPIMGVNPKNNSEALVGMYVDYLINLAHTYRYAAGGGPDPADFYRG